MYVKGFFVSPLDSTTAMMWERLKYERNRYRQRRALYIDQEIEPTKQDADRSPASCRPQNPGTDDILRYVSLRTHFHACFSHVDAQAKSVLYYDPKST